MNRIAYPLGQTVAICFALLGGLFVSAVRAQGTIADYQRMKDQAKFNGRLVDREKFQSFWLDQDRALWYRIDSSPETTEYHLVDPADKTNLLLFESTQLREQLKNQLGFENNNNGRSLTLNFDNELKTAFFKFGEQSIAFDLQSKTFSVVDKENSVDRLSDNSIEVNPSGESAEDVSVRVRNDSASEIQLFWIDQRCVARPYDKIPPGKEFSQNTYAGHTWLVRSETGKNLAYFEATAEQQITIEADSIVQLAVQNVAPSLKNFYLRGNANFESNQESGRNNSNRNNRNGGRARNRFGAGRSPDGKWILSIENHNLTLKPTDAAALDQMAHLRTEDGTEANYYNSQFFWSPNSKYFVALKEKPAQKHPVYLIESSPKDQLQPILQSFDYLKPGDEIRQVQPKLFSVADGKEIPLDDQLFDNPWSLSDYQWLEDSSEFIFRYNQRGHQAMRMIGIQPDGKTRAIVDETVPTFIDYTNKTYFHLTADRNEMLWTSERDGWNHLYRIDLQTGAVKNQITKGDWVVRRVLNIDEKKQQIWFSACGCFPDQDPYHLHFGRVNFDGSQLTWLTDGDGNHSIEYSPERKYLIDTYSRVDMAPVRELRDGESGEKICDLEAANLDRLIEAGWKIPERFVAKGRDGQTDIHGVIYRPQNFDPSRTYPVIEYIYAGPHDAFVPKTFAISRREKSLAELGFIVVQIDGMGTNHRGKKFHDVCWKNLGDSGFPDRIQWMKAAAEKYPQLDIQKVGIYGGSAGGQSSTRALLGFGDFYKVAVSDCGCHDNRMDKIWWNEQWMGWPVGDHYAEQSNVTNAHRLNGNLMLMVGELDRNVDPASTMQVVDALIKADKDFDLIVIPGGGHGSGFGNYGWRRLCDHFVRHLLNVEPRAN